MRPAELICIGFLGVFVVVALVVPLSGERRLRAVGIGVAGILIAGLLPLLEGLPGGTVARDFIPGALLMFGYWQTGQFVVGSNPRFQSFLEEFDQRWFPRAASVSNRLRRRRAVSDYLEISYLACYPLVPLGVAALYLLGRSDMVDPFWIVVLPATYATHGLTALFQSSPPWMAESADTESADTTSPDLESPSSASAEHAAIPRSALGSLNDWLMGKASIRFNTFPSGHVASAFAIAFVLFEVLPWVGLAFLWVAVSLAASCVLLRYHFVLDVVLGFAFAGLSYLILG